MTIPINMTLYRVLVKQGVSEADAEEAATIDASQLATKADLLATQTQLRADFRADIADLRSSILMWLFTALIAQTALLLTVLRAMQS